MLKRWIDTRLIYTSRGFTGFVHCTFQDFVTFTRTDAAHLYRTLEALRRTSFTPRFYSCPSLAVTGIGSGSWSHFSIEFALRLFVVITSGSVFRADVEACRRPFCRFCCFQLFSHTRLSSTSSLLTFSRFPIGFVQLFSRVCLESRRVL